MKKLIGLALLGILSACTNNTSTNSTSTTADSLHSVPSIDTAQHVDTASYERMPNNMQGSDSAK